MSTKKFEIKLRVKDRRDKEVIELNKSEDIEVEWKENLGKAKKEIVFQKNGKDYKIIVNLDLENCSWWTIRVKSYGFYEPPNSPYQIYHGDNMSTEPKTTSDYKEGEADYLRLVNRWKGGRVILVFASVTVFTFLCFFLWKKKKWRWLFIMSLLIMILFIFSLLLELPLGYFFKIHS